MRTTGKRSIVLYIMLLAFIGGLAWFFVSLYLHGSVWAMQPYNQHISLASMGKITDRNGNILAESKEGNRIYNDDAEVRAAFLHTIGDNNGSIGTSVQATMFNKLSGYNFVTGASKTLFNSFGKDIKLSLDVDVTMAAYHALGSRKGVAALYNYKTGQMIAKISKPTFDPSYPPENIEGNPEYDGVYVDRVVSSAFTPGSVFKLVTLAAAMDKWPDSWASREYTCEGSVEIGGSSITCAGEHGTQTALQALGNSCNVYFSLLANDIGNADLQKKAEEFGFNKSVAYQGLTATKSKIDLSKADKNQLGWAGIGQYTDLSNPLHMLTLMGAIATNGSYVEPKLTDSIDLFGSLLPGNTRYMSEQQATELRNAMRSVVADYYGDDLFPAGMQISGKTGTAEVGEEKDNNCWFVGFSNNSETPYAFVVMVEDSANALHTAAPVAAAMLSAIQGE